MWERSTKALSNRVQSPPLHRCALLGRYRAGSRGLITVAGAAVDSAIAVPHFPFNPPSEENIAVST